MCTSSKITLLQGDCLELMQDITDGSIDMILADLPFGTTCNSWDIVIPLDKLWEQYHRICKPNASVVLFSQMPFTIDLVESNRKDFRYEIIWIKHIGTGHLNANRMPLKIHENILVFYKKLPKYNPQKTKGNKPYNVGSNHFTTNYGKQKYTKTVNNEGTRYPVDVVHFRSCNTKEDKSFHPTQKPIALLEYLIRTYTNEGETVLDNVMGSGSCGVAAVHTGRSFIGMELDKGYFETAKKRIEEAQAQCTLPIP